jgi:hypothetical protein
MSVLALSFCDKGRALVARAYSFVIKIDEGMFIAFEIRTA